MNELDCRHSDDIDGGGTLLSHDDASADFGEGAYVVSCPCGSWLIEDSHGIVVARSSIVTIEAYAAPRAA